MPAMGDPMFQIFNRHITNRFMVFVDLTQEQQLKNISWGLLKNVSHQISKLWDKFSKISDQQSSLFEQPW